MISIVGIARAWRSLSVADEHTNIIKNIDPVAWFSERKQQYYHGVYQQIGNNWWQSAINHE
jgi:hypothetical protein